MKLLAVVLQLGLAYKFRELRELPQREPREPRELREPGVGVVVVGDQSFQSRFAAQIRSIRCYAERHGYDLHVLNASEYHECERFRDFFFRKHCTVSTFLEGQAPQYTAAVFDGDVVVAAPKRSLEPWIRHGADIQLYNRCLFHEIMAGNYMVRNTPFARKFLMRWAEYYDEKPSGFSSSDNGAIQLAVMETLQVEGFATCYSMYRNLTEKVTNLQSYWDYVHCTKEAIGPARAWTLEKGSLTLWPRLEFYVADGVFLNRWASDEIGPIMHHGVKDPKDVTSFYYQDLQSCELNASVLVPPQQLGEAALHLAQSYPEYFPAGQGCKQCGECMKTFSCEPLQDAEQPRPRQVSDFRRSSFSIVDSAESRRHSWGWSRWS